MNPETMMLSRKIIISSPINEVVAEQVVSQILAINDFDAQMSVVSTYQPEPIEMYINSGGGSATDGFAIIGAMEMSETPIITYGLGIVASMALGIFVMGDVRIAHRFTRFMYHSVAYGAMGNIQDHEDGHKEADLLQRMYNDLFKETKISKEKMQEIRERKADFFFSGKEAVKLGVADEVLLKPEKKIKMVTEEELAQLQEELGEQLQQLNIK
jgi:ATP-dependent Clp protease, protease subunit